MTKAKKIMSIDKVPDSKLTAKQFLNSLFEAQKKTLINRTQPIKKGDNQDIVLGVRMLNIFTLARQFMLMPLKEVEILLASDYYEARMGAVSIMDFQARDKRATDENKKQLYELYLKCHGKINKWDYVDRAAPYVIGGYLFDKSRLPLYKLAKSKKLWERRTAIVATYYFIRKNDVDVTFKIAELLVCDKEDSINKAVGSWIREAGKKDKKKLVDFLNQFASTMPRVTLRYAIEKFDKKEREKFMALK